MDTKHPATATAEPRPQLVSGPQLLKVIWPDDASRPAKRTLDRWKKQGLLPFVKIGKMVFYDPVKVQRTIDRQFTVTETNQD